MDIDVQAIARAYVTEMENKSVTHKLKADGARELYGRITDAAREAAKVSTQSGKPGRSKKTTKQGS